MRLKNKIALLAGVGIGMGRATALLFAQEGAKVVINARRSDQLEETTDRINSMGGDVLAVCADVADQDQANRTVAQALARHGRIDILYCGAGGNFKPTRDFSDVNPEFHEQTIKNNVTTLHNLAQAAQPQMRAQGGGAIVSVAASFSVSQEGNPAYGAAKGGIIGLAKNLARELYRDNIRVNVLLPGLFRGKLGDGKMSPASTVLARTGYPQDIAYAALYLASDEAAWVTGQVLAVDGGVDVGTRPLWEFENPSI